MHKFTIFTILFSIIVIVVVAELVVNDYLNDYNSWGQIPGFVSSIKEVEKAPFQDEIAPADVSAPAEDYSTISDSIMETKEAVLITSIVTKDFLSKAGFIEPDHKKVEFNGKIFQLISVEEEEDIVTKFNIFEKEDFAASIYEARFSDEVLASSFYNFLRDKGNNMPGFSQNESNRFGLGSFYTNSLEEQKKTVLLVVKFKKSVYCFEYPHKSHEKVSELIDIIAVNE